MKPYPRADRISSKIQEVISEVLLKKVQDPRVEMATISKVELNSDLSIAHVFFSVFGDEKTIFEAHQGFKSSKKYIKKMIAPRLKLKYMPDIQFRHDTSFEYGSKMDKLLDNISKNKSPEQE